MNLVFGNVAEIISSLDKSSSCSFLLQLFTETRDSTLSGEVSHWSYLCDCDRSIGPVQRSGHVTQLTTMKKRKTRPLSSRMSRPQNASHPAGNDTAPGYLCDQSITWTVIQPIEEKCLYLLYQDKYCLMSRPLWLLLQVIIGPQTNMRWMSIMPARM